MEDIEFDQQRFVIKGIDRGVGLFEVVGLMVQHGLHKHQVRAIGHGFQTVLGGLLGGLQVLGFVIKDDQPHPGVHRFLIVLQDGVQLFHSLVRFLGFLVGGGNCFKRKWHRPI